MNTKRISTRRWGVKLTAVLALVLLALALPALPGALAESSEIYSFAGWAYKLEGDCAVVIAGPYDAELIVPSLLNGHVVTAIGASAFRMRGNLKSVVIPEGVTRIDISAFYNCTALESVTLPNSLTSIGTGVFESCPALSTVNLPGGLTSIGNDAFNGCAALTTVDFPGSLTSIGDDAFRNCISLSSASFSEGLTSIGNNAFFGCKALKTAILPNSLTALGHDAFMACSELKTVHTGDGLTAISEAAFFNCISLVQVYIGNHVQRIESGAFQSCIDLKDLFVPTGVTEIADDAFRNHNAGLTLWGEDVSTAHDHAVAQGINFSDVYGWLTWEPAADGECTITGHGTQMGLSIAIPDTLGGRRVTKIGENAFSNCDGLARVVIPLSVAEIGTGAFENCVNLTTLVMRGGVRTIGFAAFHNCHRLERVDIPMGVETIEGAAFERCISLRSVSLPGGLKEIGKNAFRECAALTDIDIPEGTTALGMGAFKRCTSLAHAAIPGSVVGIGKEAFMGCTGLERVDIGAGVVTIDSGAFEGCESLTRIDLPKGVTEICIKAFKDCKALTMATVPVSVTRIEQNAFQFSGLADLYYGSTLAMWDRVKKSQANIPKNCVVHTISTVDVQLTLTGQTAADAVALTDGSGTYLTATASGAYPLSIDDAQIVVSAGAGRKYRITVQATLPTGAVQTAMCSGTGSNTFPLEPYAKAVEVTVAFEVDEEAVAIYLHVNEERFGSVPSVSIDSDWQFSTEDKAYQDGDLLLQSDGFLMPVKAFTLSVDPNGTSCVGQVTQNGNVLGFVTNSLTNYSCTFEPFGAGDVEVSLKWYNRDSYAAVRYDGNGSNGSMSAQISHKSDTWIVPQNQFDGCISGQYNLFSAWNTAADGTGDTYLPGQAVVGLSNNLTLYAQWLPAWRVAFNANGGEGIMVPVLTLRSAPAVTLPACGYTLQGKAFAGWNTKKDGSGDAWADGQEITLTKDITLYAQWVDAWTVTFDPNGGDGAAFARSVARGGALTLPDSLSFSREKYGFAGWNADPDGDGDACEAGASFTPSADATLYAQWTPLTYDINCAYCEAFNEHGDVVTQAAEGERITLCELDDESLSDDVYFTFEFASDDVGIDAENGFTMPAGPVSVAAVTAPRMRPALNLVTRDSAIVPYQVAWGLADLYAPEEYQGGDPLEIDLNGDGATDVILVCAIYDEDESTMTRAAGADALTGPVAVTLYAEAPHYLQYSGCLINSARIYGEPDFVLPGELDSIGESAFEGDASIVVVDIPDGCTRIGAKAFKDCSGLAQIRIPDSVTDIAATAFDGCGAVQVFGPAGSAAQHFCRNSPNCVFAAIEDEAVGPVVIPGGVE